jgi:hypothetical protein
MTYANVVATLALVFAMAGGAAAASHYLITSTKQISPKVLKELKKTGARGATGPAGAQGAQGAAGANGVNGAAGAKGEPGPEGKQGPKGERGEKGEAGPAGGPEGPEGKQGPEGKEGKEGKPGAEGKAGPEGKPGEKGNTSLPAVTWNKKVETAGASIATPKTVVLETIGPFTLVGWCYIVSDKTVANTFIETSENGVVFAETGGFEEELVKGEAIPVGAGSAESLTASHEAAFNGPVEGPFAAQNKTGTIALNGQANEAVFLGNKASPACYFTGTVTEEK